MEYLVQGRLYWNEEVFEDSMLDRDRGRYGGDGFGGVGTDISHRIRLSAVPYAFSSMYLMSR